MLSCTHDVYKCRKYCFLIFFFLPLIQQLFYSLASKVFIFPSSKEILYICYTFYFLKKLHVTFHASCFKVETATEFSTFCILFQPRIFFLKRLFTPDLKSTYVGLSGKKFDSYTKSWILSLLNYKNKYRNRFNSLYES